VGGGAEAGVKEKSVLSGGMLVPEDPVAGCPSLPKRHMDIPSTQPSRLIISADGSCRVSPSFEGVLLCEGR
jgi:hypothetical protein